METREALVGLNLVPGIGSIRLRNLLELFGTAHHVLEASPEKLQLVPGIGCLTARRIASVRKEDIKAELSAASGLGLRIIEYGSAEYPFSLSHISDPPLILYVKGSLTEQDSQAIAVVGSRNASFYGLSCSEKFSSRLAEAGFTIVSGMARGVDTSAHRGAIRAGGRTIAVMGSGFGRLYPPENASLADQIARQGAVISEFPVHTPPARLNFPRRNRVISGLSLGVLVVEAARNSGALITADFALEQGKEVFAIPGSLDNPGSCGANELIKQGAGLVSSPEEVIRELGYEAVSRGRSLPEVNRNLSEKESVVYNILTDSPQELDGLRERLGIALPLLYPVLTGLELKGLIQQLPGKWFRRT